MPSLLTTLPWWRPEPWLIPLPDLDFLPSFLPIQPFGMLVATAVLVGVTLSEWRAKREDIDPAVLSGLAGWILVFGFVFGHVLDSIFYHWEWVVRDPMMLLQPWRGLSSFGGFFGAVLGGIIWRYRTGFSFIALADPIAWAFPFGWLFGRLGCAVVHDHPGVISDFFLAIDDYHIPGEAPPYPPRHDLGLYEVFWCLVAMALFLYLGQTKRKRGFYLALLPLLYAPVRFALDFLRATDVPGGDPRFYGLTPGHYAAIVLFALGIWTWARVHRGPEITVPEGARWIPEGESEPPPHAPGEALAEPPEPPEG